MESLTRQAPAKLNLALQVHPPRADGLHPIRSWMVAVDLCDEMELVPLSPGSLSRYAIIWHDEAVRPTEIDWSVSDDLAVRAHLAVEAAVGRHLPVQMKLEKRIPVGAGLGGGSSNAAAMIAGLNDLFDLQMDRRDVTTIGASIGSDVPFFLLGPSGIVSGVGDRVSQGPDVEHLAAVVVISKEICSTPSVYDRFDEMNAPTSADARFDAVVAGDGDASPFNDLSPAAFSLSPTLSSIVTDVSAITQRDVHLTGSGSALFVLCEDTAHAQSLAREICQASQYSAVAVSRWCGGNGTMGQLADDVPPSL